MNRTNVTAGELYLAHREGAAPRLVVVRRVAMHNRQPVAWLQELNPRTRRPIKPKHSYDLTSIPHYLQWDCNLNVWTMGPGYQPTEGNMTMATKKTTKTTKKTSTTNKKASTATPKAKKGKGKKSDKPATDNKTTTPAPADKPAEKPAEKPVKQVKGSAKGGADTRNKVDDKWGKTRVCARCEKKLTMDNFYIYPNGRPHVYCFACRREVQKERYEANKKKAG